MAQGKSSTPGKSGNAGSGGAAKRPARPSGSSRAGGSRPAGSGTTKVHTSRPAGRGPAQRPPARRKKSIVNQKQTPWGFIISGAAVVVFAVAIVLVVVLNNNGSSNSSSGDPADQIIPTTPTGSVTKQAAVTKVKNTTGVPGVIAYDTAGYPAAGTAGKQTLQHQHVTGPVDYSLTPPAGGPHNAIWMNAGVYTKPVPSERAVHNLEHGAIWITYRPDLSKSDVAKLRDFVGKQSFITEAASAEDGTSSNSNRYMDLSPWASNSLPAPIVMSSWGYQLYLQSPTDSRMQKFVDTFRNSSKYTPEYGSAVDGIPIQTGGRPAYDGSKKANPPGAYNGG